MSVCLSGTLDLTLKLFIIIITSPFQTIQRNLPSLHIIKHFFFVTVATKLERLPFQPSLVIAGKAGAFRCSTLG
jgi:hypothetical protein